jgi:hypothetical protein
MPTDPSPTHDKPLSDSQAGQNALPVFDVPSEGDIDLEALQSKAGDDVPLATLLKPPPAPIPDSQVGQNPLPKINVPSEGDIDLEALQSKAGDDIPLAALVKTPPAPLSDSQVGQNPLPKVTVPSEGDIDLEALQSKAGDGVPLAALVKTPPPPIPDSQAGQNSLPTFDVPSEGEIDIGSLQSKADEEIPLAALPESPSGQSLTSWTEVIRRQRAAAQAGQASSADFKVDAPSDKDILIRFDEDVRPPRRTGDTSEILPGELPVYTAPSGRSESDIELGAAGPGGTGESEVKFDILYPPSDAAGVMPAPVHTPRSGIDFRTATPVRPPSSPEIPFASVVDPASGVNLGAAPGLSAEGSRSSILDALLEDASARPRGGSSASVLDFGSLPPGTLAPPEPPSATAPPTVPTPPSVDLGGSAHELSGRDLVGADLAIESEDAIDLYAEPAASPSITDSGTLEISEKALEESQRKAEIQESSSVDLSSRPSYHGTEFDSALEAPSGVEHGSDSDIDMNLPVGAEADENSSLIHRASANSDSDALAAEFQARRRAKEMDGPPKKPAPAKRREVVPARKDAAPAGRSRLIGASAFGLLLGAGGVVAAYLAGALPDRGASAKGPDQSAEIARLRQDADVARKEAAAAKADVGRQMADARKADADKINKLEMDSKEAVAQKTEAVAQMNRAVADARKAETDKANTVKAMNDAKASVQTVQANLTAATKAADDAKKQLADAVAAKKAADDAYAGLTKTLAAAGIDATKPDDGIKKLADARSAAEAKAKDADAKLAEATKKVTDLTALADTAKKSYDDARKAAEDAVKAREASDATVKAVADRLARAKLVGEKADAAALLKGIDDAVKAGTSDTTQALRDELAKVRSGEEKAKADLAAARDKEAAASKAAAEAKADAQKAGTELARVTAEAAKLKQDASEAIAKATAAQRAAAAARETADAAAAEARAATERTATDVARLKAENDRLSRDLEAVKELAELLKTASAGQVAGPLAKPDPDRLAEQFFGDGLRAFHRGQSAEAESGFRKALQFRPNDARYHYFLGLTLWVRKETAGAEAEFEKGRDLELAGRPSSRTVSTALERIQGPARQAVDAYRP